jgi:hypothetical protein
MQKSFSEPVSQKYCYLAVGAALRIGRGEVRRIIFHHRPSVYASWELHIDARRPHLYLGTATRRLELGSCHQRRATDCQM